MRWERVQTEWKNIKDTNIIINNKIRNAKLVKALTVVPNCNICIGNVDY